MEETVSMASEDTPMDNFLICQFSSLGSHVDGLFNSGAQRINAYLVLAGLAFAGMQLLPDDFPQKTDFLALGSIFVAIVGIWIYIATIHITIRAIQYYRIMNEIRGYFIKNNEIVKSILRPLPLTRIEPKWNTQVFDPGIILVKAIISLSIAISAGIVVYKICQICESLKGYLLYIDIFVFLIVSLISWYVLSHYESYLRKKKVDSNQLDYAPFIDQAWQDLHRLTQDQHPWVSGKATEALGNVFSHIPDKDQAYQDLHKLTYHLDSYVRRSAAYALCKAFSYIPDIDQAWQDLHRLTQDQDSYIRVGAIYGFGSAFSELPNKE